VPQAIAFDHAMQKLSSGEGHDKHFGSVVEGGDIAGSSPTPVGHRVLRIAGGRTLTPSMNS